ncbi:hypothetical protein EYZ11_006882 [Aspergillus tanneri]|uniref:Uncharacterized protein n=1 Tax=Aspergillus tanneri TaxID=1220188 RepID=A0A4S3JEN9_9EURO|nr:uncharacterized protein ATNIH1004_008741 [Aspergillus tanneri]KAA8644537.1 hypothetical protein ATNIH1004_008741 [Aspergillus tanneri]THC93632.1 hypothetical protein EYZ11_006882 [Aspergillus tanneri]
MSLYLEPEELRDALNKLARDPFTEEMLSRRFREAYSPFEPAVQRHAGVEHDLRVPQMPDTPYSAYQKTPLPSVATGQTTFTPKCTVPDDLDKNKGLAAHTLETVGQMSLRERISTWRRSSCHGRYMSVATNGGVPSMPMADEYKGSPSVDQLEMPTAIASSYSCSDDGDCIHANGDIEVKGARASPIEKMTSIIPKANKTKKDSKQAYKTNNGAKAKRGREELPDVPHGSPDESHEPIDPKGFFTKRRRSARIAALEKKDSK